MNNTKEGDLVLAVLIYAMRCFADGDWLALRQMQFGEKEVEALGQLSINDLHRAESLKAHCLSVVLNRQVFWHMIEHLMRQRKENDLMLELMQKDAPFEFMRAHFGMSSREYSARRKNLGRNTGVGRPNLPDHDTQDELYRVWSRMYKELEGSELQASDYLKLSEETGVSLRAIWQLTQSWVDFAA